MKKEIERVEKEVEKLRKGDVTTELGKAGKQIEKFVGKITYPFVQDKRKLTLGQRASDNLTKWAGSWFFIIGFLFFLVLWIVVNSYFLLKYHQKAFDPFPFILLNLALSCLAAIQAPVILMSQNRTTQRDRMRAEYDYQVNRKAEKEIQEMKKQLDRIERKIK